MTEELHLDELLQSRIKTMDNQSIFTSNSKVLEREIEVTNEAIQQVGNQIKLHINKKIIIPKQQQISLISGNNRSRSNNETVKRHQPNQGTPEILSNQYTRDDIRRKIIHENARLKNSLDALRQDVNIYKQNQMSILEVLKESKLKIIDYKSQIKSKSKKISDLIDNNIILKTKIDQLQGKIGNITSYSEWQQMQIQQLKKEVAQKFLQLQQQQVLKTKIDKLQQILKDYQQQLPQDSQSNITNSPHPLSTHSLSEPRMPTPYSIKQMGIQELQMIRQYEGGDQEYNRLEEYNLSLKAKIEEMEGELEALKVDNDSKKRLLDGFQREKEEKEEVFIIKINNILEKSQELSGKIEEKDINITILQQQMQLQRQNNLKKQQQYLNSLNTLKLDISNLQKIIQQKSRSITNLHEQLNQKQQFFNRQFQQISLQFNANQQKYTSQLKQSQQKIKDLQKMINEDEIKMEQLLAQNEQLNQFRNQVHQKYQYAQKIIKERKDYQQFIEKLQSKIHYLENLPNDNLEYYQSKLEESQKYIRSLENQKNQHQAEFQQYALQIRLLKNQIKDLSRQRRDHIDNLDPSINVIQQQPQQSQGGLISNTSLQQRQNTISGVHPHDQQQRKKQDFIPIFQSFPIEKEEELPPRKQSEDKSKNKSSDVYQRIIRNLREENSTLRSEKQEIMKKYTMDIVEANNQYFIEREKQGQLTEKIKKLEEELLQAGNNFIAKKFELEVKQTTIQQQQRRINQYEQHIQDLQLQNTKIIQQIKQKSDLIIKYQSMLQEANSKLRDLTAKLSILTSQKQQLIQSKIKYQLSLQKMREQKQKLSSSKDMLTTSLQLQQNFKQNIENQLMESKRLIKLAEEQKLSQKAVAQKMRKQNQELHYKIREIEERMKILSNQKNTMQEELIGYISDKDKLIEMQSKFKSENQELKIMKKQHLERIEVVEKQILIKDNHISQLQKELDLSKVKNNQLQQSLSSKSQDLRKCQRKISQMQEYQRQTMSQIQEKLCQLSTIINEQKAQILKLTAQKQQYLNKKETLTRSVSQLNESQQNLKEVTGTMQRQLQILNQQNSQLNQNVKNISQENVRIKLQNTQLKENILAYEKQTKIFLAQKQKLMLQYQILKKQNEQTKSKLRINQKMFKDISLNIANLKQSLDFSHSQQSQQSPTSVKQNQDSISLKLQQNEHGIVSIDNLKQEITQIQHKHKYVIEDYEKKLRSTSSHFQEASKQKEGKIQQLNNQVKILKQENTELVHSKDSLQLIIKQLKQTMAEYIDSIDRLEASLSSEREIISSKDLIIQGLEKTISIKKSQTEQKQKIIHEMQEKHRLLRAEFESKTNNEEQTDNRFKQMQKEWGFERQSQKKIVLALRDQLQVSKKMMQEAEEEYQLKMNRINKELSNCRFLLEQTQKQSSFRLEQSTKSITQVKNQLKMFNQSLRLKDEQIRQLKLCINSLKQQNHQLRIRSQRDEEQSNNFKSVKQQLQSYISTLDNEIQCQKQELKRQREMRQKYIDQQSTLTNEINRLNLGIQQKISEKEMIFKEKQFLYSKLQRQVHDKVKMQDKIKDMTIQIKTLQQNYNHLEQQYKKIQRKNQQEQQQLQVSTSNLIQQRKIIEGKYFNLIKQKDEQIESLKSGQNKIHKQYQTRIQNLCLEHKDLLLEVENQHSKQIEKKDEQIEKVIRQSKTYIDHFKDKEKQARQELDKIKQTLKKLQKEFENQRGQLTDKVLQLTQQNNESIEVIQNLRNGIVSKGNQIEQCKDIIEKLQQQLEEAKAQLSQINSLKSIPAQGEDDYQLSHASEKISKLEIIMRQKERIEKQLNEKIEKMKQRQNRQRNSSVESMASKSRVFDERNTNLLKQLEDTKNRLESAEAYIQLLEDQEHKLKEEINRDGNHKKNANVQDLQAQIEDLKMKVEFLQALNHQLENGNDNQSVRSKRRNDSLLRQPQKMKKSISQISDSNNLKIQGYSDPDLNQKIQLLINFVDSYTRDHSSGQKQQALKSQLNHPGLQDLLSTIFYHLQKQAIIYKDKEHVITDLHEEIDTLHEEIRILKQNITFMDRKCSVLEGYQKKYQQSQKSIEELINSKMKDEADVAQCRSYIEELEDRLGKYQSKKEESKKEALQILEQQNQSSSDSMMSESADSEIPSSVSQSNNFKSSIAMSRRIKGDYLSMSKSIVRAKSFNANEQKIHASQFLRKTLSTIKYLQEQVQIIERQLQSKTKLLNIALNDNISKEQLINKLSIIQSKIKINDKQIKNHFETSELEVAALIKDLLRYRQEKDQYGLQNQSRRKIQDYLSLLEQQLTKSSKFYEQESVKIQENSRKSEMNRLSLHEIKQDAVNEDKGSSIVYPRGQVLRSFSNSQGATQSLDINQIKINYNEALKQLHQTHDELSIKQDQLRNIYHRYIGIQNDVCGILDEIRIYFEEDQYLFEQVENIKKLLSKFQQQEAPLDKVRQSIDRQEQDRMAILVQSNKKELQFGSRKVENPFDKIIKFTEEQFKQSINIISNQHLKQIYTKISQILDCRYDQCLQFLNTQKSLIADILRIRNDEGFLQQTINKIASKLTQEQVADIITNSPNVQQANKILTSLLKEEDSKSMISDDQDFSPNIDKIQEIRNKIYGRPTQLCLTMHNQLIEILGAPTRQDFYGLIEQFYYNLKEFEEKYRNSLSQRDEFSQNHSIRLKRALQMPSNNLEDSIQKFDFMEIKHQKNRSSSCAVNVVEES